MSDLHKNFQAYQELQEQICALQEKATLLLMEGRTRALEDIRALVAAYDIGPQELGFAVPPAPPKRDRTGEKKRDRTIKGEPKYRDPQTGSTWTGTGRVPNWLIGKNHDDYLIAGTAPQEQAAPAPADAAPPPAVPATTWTGNGTPGVGTRS